MIASSPNPSPAARAMPPCAMAAGAGTTDETALFSAILSAFSVTGADESEALDAAVADPALAITAATIALPGNMLPPLLPLEGNSAEHPGTASFAARQASPTLPAAMPDTAADLPQPDAAPLERPALLQTVRLASPPSEEVTLAIALPRAANVPAETPESDLPIPVIDPVPSGGSAPRGQTAAALPASGTAGTLRPHDFSALIDRLSAARDAGGMTAVSVTVAHQDFGPVRLHFRPEESGLSVSLTSPDPDFARVAAAAPAPVQPVQGGAQAGSGADQRSPGDAAAHGGNAQPRGDGSPGQRGSHQPQIPAPSPRRAEIAPAPRNGIFA